MPELPDIERYRTLIQQHGLGARIAGIEARDSTVLRNDTFDHANVRVRGHVITAVERVGKWLFFATDGPTVVIHLGMTGVLRWAATSTDDERRFDRLTFVTTHGALRYEDQRKLGGIWLAADVAGAQEIIGPHGPDALAISCRAFVQLGARRGSIKAVLMDQSLVAGLGNMLSDEVLWRAGVHPTRPANTLSQDELGRLHRTMRSTLRSAVRFGAIPRTRRWLSGQRASSRPTCPRCTGGLEWLRVAGRSSLICPNEQATQTVRTESSPP